MNTKGSDLLIGDKFLVAGDNQEYKFEGHFTSASKADLIVYSYHLAGKREFKVSRSNIDVVTIE